jgi:hypothetical protein
VHGFQEIFGVNRGRRARIFAIGQRVAQGLQFGFAFFTPSQCSAESFIAFVLHLTILRLW